MNKTKESELKYVLDYSREDYMDFFSLHTTSCTSNCGCGSKIFKM